MNNLIEHHILDNIVTKTNHEFAKINQDSSLISSN